MDLGRGSYRMAQAHYVYFAVYIYYYCMLVISDHQALDYRVQKPLLQVTTMSPLDVIQIRSWKLGR